MKKIILAALLLLSSLSFSAVTKDGYIYTLRKDQLEKALDIAISGDTEGFSYYMAQLEEYGQGGVMVEGIEVYISSRSWGLVEIRVKGSSQTFWTIEEAVEE